MSTRNRTKILDAYKTRIWDLFNSTDGTEVKIFRNGWRRPLRPVSQCPSFTVTDNGQRRADDLDNESEGRILSVRIFFHVADTWERESDVQDWSDYIDRIDTKLRGRPSGYGVEDILYVSDDPFDVVFTSGSSQAVWVLDHEVRYFEVIDEFEDWNL